MRTVRVYVAAAAVGAAHTLEWWVLLQGATVHREPSREEAQTRAVAVATALRDSGTAAEVWLSVGGRAVRYWPAHGTSSDDGS